MEEKPTGRTRLTLTLMFAVPISLIAVSIIALMAAAPANAARYTVSECGWYVGHDANWIDTSGSKFNRSAYCQVPRERDAFDGVHLSSETTKGPGSIAGTKFAGWRWTAPSGVTLTTVHGHRWQVVRDNFEHRLGTVSPRGFEPFLKLATTDTARRDFRQNGLPAGTTAFESRLLCARSADKRCSIDKSSMAGVRALTFTLEDPLAPTVTVSGDLATDRWLRGSRNLGWNAKDRGSGLRFSDTSIDGAVRIRTEHRCSKVTVGGLVRGGRMQPCETAVTGQHTLNTASLSDGPHQLRHCALDFAGTSGCTATQTVRTDNTAPGVPRELAVAGGDGWRRTNGFDLTWEVPDQGVAAPVVASRLRLVDPDGREGPAFTGVTPAQAKAITVAGPGEFLVRVWLADAAGNEREQASAKVTLRFDNVPPVGYFRTSAPGRPELLQVPVSDRHSGIAGGTIAVRPLKGGTWRDLPTGLSGSGEERELTARMPSEEFGPGEWVARATIADQAGNETVTSRRGDGSTVVLRAPLKAVSSLTAKLVGKRTSGPMVRVKYGRRAALTGSLMVAGRGLSGKTIRVTEQPRAGSRQRALTRQAVTGTNGRFRIGLRSGPSRRVTVSFPGDDRFSSASAGPFVLRVRGGLTFKARPRSLKNGGVVRFSGRVKAKGARRPVTGSVVAIQYLERASGRWRPVLMARTGRNGTFRAGYRFRYITGNTRIRLRAVLLATPWFPYDRAISRAVAVRVRG